MSLYEGEIYRQAKNFTVFRKPSRLLHFEGMFLELPHSDHCFLYFEKINDEMCREKISGMMFSLTDDNNFYSEETGLYFDMGNFLEASADDYYKDVDDKKYLEDVYQFFDYYTKFKKEDDEKRAKAECLLLRKGIIFRK